MKKNWHVLPSKMISNGLIMVDLLFFVDFEMGHVFPTFKVAANAEKSGLSVAYLALSDIKPKVEAKGFTSYTIFENLYPSGFTEALNQARLQQADVEEDLEQHLEAIIQGSLDEVIDACCPKLILCSSFLSLEALLLHYQYDIPIVILRPNLPDQEEVEGKTRLDFGRLSAQMVEERLLRLKGKTMNRLLELLQDRLDSMDSLQDVVKPMLDLPHLILCPQALSLDTFLTTQKDLFIGPCIQQADPDQWNALACKLGSRKLIYASMGSQINVYPKQARLFFEAAINCMKMPELQDYLLLLSTGGSDVYVPPTEPLDNVQILKWAPQKEILERADLAIIHGGLGSVKESIFFGVPMIVIPLGRDQFENAERVVQHGLGRQLKIEQVDASSLFSTIQEIQANGAILEKVKAFQVLFQELDDEQLEIPFLQHQIQAKQPDKIYVL